MAHLREMETDIHDHFRDLCRGITLRLVPQGALGRLSDDHRFWGFGAITRALIAPDPDGSEFLAFDDSRKPICPICGEPAKGPAEALRAMLELEFEKLKSGGIAQFAWAHVHCLASCLDTGEQRGIPW